MNSTSQHRFYNVIVATVAIILFAGMVYLVLDTDHLSNSAIDQRRSPATALSFPSTDSGKQTDPQVSIAASTAPLAEPLLPENANPIEVETGKLGIHIPTTKQQFQQMYRGGRCGADKLTLTLMKSVSAATSECSIHKPCDPNPDAFECTLVRIGYNRLDQAVYYQITLNHDKSTPLAKDSVRYKFDTLYGEDQQDVVLGKQGEYIAVKNSARIGDLKISFIYLRTTSDPSNMLLLMYSVQK